MVIIQNKSKRSFTGARYISARKKKQYDAGREPTLTKIGNVRKRVIRGMGGNYKTIILSSNEVNVIDKKTNKCFKAKILTVKKNPANINYVRRNIITKGCTVATDKGDVLITSRPGQDGTINGVLI